MGDRRTFNLPHIALDMSEKKGRYYVKTEYKCDGIRMWRVKKLQHNLPVIMYNSVKLNYLDLLCFHRAG